MLKPTACPQMRGSEKKENEQRRIKEFSYNERQRFQVQNLEHGLVELREMSLSLL